MKLVDAELIAGDILKQLIPCCVPGYCRIAGSVRRKKPDVGDIEIVCIPRGRELATYKKTIEQRNKVRGDWNAKATKRLVTQYGEHIELDIFTATPSNWGLIYAIRTGSAEFSYQVLAVGWSKKGYHSRNGILYDADERATFVKEEEDLFTLIGKAFVPPEKRDV
jgi:DNA polymerase/3'-5' exonuclease PolX